jgi:hypothetical protein
MDQQSNTFEFGLTSDYIDRISKKLCKNYYGIYPCDYLDSIFSSLKKKTFFSVIVNLSPSTEIGDHFIAIVKRSHKLLYIDSFGKKCFNRQISDFMQKFDIPIFCNTTKIQSELSIFCGFFCIYMCVKYDEKKEKKEKWFVEEKDLIKNDKLCIDLIKKNIS